ncbi:MAG: imelysin family protein, partial [Alphaproteobacteria bacterium]
MWRTFLAALIALPVAVPAAADAPPDPAALARAVDGADDRMIAPAYRSFAEAATTARVRIDALCAAPSAEALAAARDGFAGAVVAFAAIEPF